MARAQNLVVGVLAFLLVAPGTLSAQYVPDGWQQILDKAKTQKLVVTNQGSPA